MASWSGWADLDVYIYQQGQDLIKGAPLNKFQSSDYYEETISYTASSSGTYYVRVVPYDIKDDKLAYTLNLTVAGASYQYSGLMEKNRKIMTAIAIERESTQGCNLNITVYFTQTYLSGTSVVVISPSYQYQTYWLNGTYSSLSISNYK